MAKTKAGRAAALLALLLQAPAEAAPFIPQSDDFVIAVLPPAALRAPAGDTRAQLREAIATARREGDPRYLGRAEALLIRLRQTAPEDAETLRLDATVRQALHDFPASLALLDRVLRRNPDDPQALLTRAAVRLVQGEAEASRADCARFATSHIGLAATACTAAAMASLGYGRAALQALVLELSHPLAVEDRPTRLFAATLAAELAVLLADTRADALLAAAADIDPGDPYLLAVRADFLLGAGRPREVLRLLAGRESVDPLLLRLALAARLARDARAGQFAADLAARFAIARARGETVHRREEARFLLCLRGDAAGALALARRNWRVQREPADAAILMASAEAAGMPAAAAEAAQAVARAGWSPAALLAPIAATLAPPPRQGA